MVGLDRSENLAALARRVGFAEGDSAGGGDQVPLVVHDLASGEGRKDDGRRREVMVGDVLDLGGVREGSMVRSELNSTPSLSPLLLRAQPQPPSLLRSLLVRSLYRTSPSPSQPSTTSPPLSVVSQP